MIKKQVNKIVNNSKFSFNSKYVYIGVAVLVLAIVIIFLLVQNGFAKTVKAGDSVKLDYTGYLEDGKVFDTSVKEIGDKNSLNKQEYKPFEFKAGSGQVVPGFDKAVLGMKVGETKTFELQPYEAYGIKREDLIIKNKLELQMKKVLEVNADVFKRSFNKEPVLNEEFQSETLPWKLKIVKITKNTISVENLLTKGENVVIPGTTWDSKVVDVKNGMIIIMQNPKVGDYVAFPTQQGFVTGTVTVVDNVNYEIDANHPLAGKKLKFEVTLLQIN